LKARYFDNASTTPMRREAFEVMERFLFEEFGNPSNLHQCGLRAHDALEAARTVIAASIGAGSKDIIFTGSGTESNNLAILGTARRQRRFGAGSHVVTTSIEHPSVLNACRALEREGFEVTYVGVDEWGRVNCDEVVKAVRPDTVLVSVMHANNVTGTLQPVREIGRLLKERKGVLFHCDAVQSYGKVQLAVDDLQVDLLTLNAHKLGGPKGIAALYVRKGVRIDPLVYGGEQERGLRPATQNVAGITAFAKAVELATAEMEQERERMWKLRGQLLKGLLEIPGLRLNGHERQTLPSHVNISIPQVEGQALMLELDRRGIFTSSGSACSSTDNEPSYVLLAMGKSRDVALESLRITMGRMTTERSVAELLEALKVIAAEFQRRHLFQCQTERSS
jgi:cysteine desulfurase